MDKWQLCATLCSLKSKVEKQRKWNVALTLHLIIFNTSVYIQNACCQALWQTSQANCCLGGALIFKRWCCQSTLSRCTLAHTGGLSHELQRLHSETRREDKNIKVDVLTITAAGKERTEGEKKKKKSGAEFSFASRRRSPPLLPPRVRPGPSSPGRS